ncbi:hypothetical protein PtB15_1B774 [Puccinia triticina]|nr:hypothetical protein PtB15_1B774 [Puccinia triticina]
MTNCCPRWFIGVDQSAWTWRPMSRPVFLTVISRFEAMLCKRAYPRGHPEELRVALISHDASQLEFQERVGKLSLRVLFCFPFFFFFFHTGSFAPAPSLRPLHGVLHKHHRFRRGTGILAIGPSSRPSFSRTALFLALIGLSYQAPPTTTSCIFGQDLLIGRGRIYPGRVPRFIALGARKRVFGAHTRLVASELPDTHDQVERRLELDKSHRMYLADVNCPTPAEPTNREQQTSLCLNQSDS